VRARTHTHTHTHTHTSEFIPVFISVAPLLYLGDSKIKKNLYSLLEHNYRVHTVCVTYFAMASNETQ